MENKIGWSGPCPADNTNHSYTFKLYALNIPNLSILDNFKSKDFENEYGGRGCGSNSGGLDGDVVLACSYITATASKQDTVTTVITPSVPSTTVNTPTVPVGAGNGGNNPAVVNTPTVPAGGGNNPAVVNTPTVPAGAGNGGNNPAVVNTPTVPAGGGKWWQ